MSLKDNRERLDDILDRPREEREQFASGVEESLLERPLFRKPFFKKPLRKKFSLGKSGWWWQLAFILSLVWYPVYYIGALLLILGTAYTPYADLLDLFFANGIIGIDGWYVIGVLIIWLVLYKIDEDRK